MGQKNVSPYLESYFGAEVVSGSEIHPPLITSSESALSSHFVIFVCFVVKLSNSIGENRPPPPHGREMPTAAGETFVSPASKSVQAADWI
jgi:hypothetical protein